MSALRQTAAEVLCHLCRVAPCSDRESSFPLLRNHCPSMLPVTEKAQQDPHMPCNTHSPCTQKQAQKTIHNMLCCYALLFFSRSLAPDSSLHWQHRDPSSRSWRGRGLWRRRLVSLACEESTDSGGDSDMWIEILPLVGILEGKLKQDISQSWHKGMFLKRSQWKANKRRRTSQVAELGDSIFSGTLIQGLELLSGPQILVEDLQTYVCLCRKSKGGKLLFK